MKTVRKIQYPLLTTPLHTLPILSQKTGVELLIKRDDLNGIGLGGNKIRKLAYLVQDALDQKADTLLTYGGVQTNHGRLTAAAASMAGLSCGLILSGEKPPQPSGNLLLDQLFGAELNFKQEQESDEEVRTRVLNHYAKLNKIVYEIPLGGSSPLGILGYVEAIKEILDQLEDMNQTIDILVVAVGSGGTFAGLNLGKMLYQAPFEILGMNVLFPKNEEVALHTLISTSMEQTNRLYNLNLNLNLNAKPPRIIMETVGKGYNKSDTKTHAIMQLMARCEGIILDYCYTGKAFLGLMQAIEQGLIQPGQRVLFLHTGGAPGIFSDTHARFWEKS